MAGHAPWIWVPEKDYPDKQKSAYSAMSEKKADAHAVAEFKKEYVFATPVKEVQLSICGDAAFQLYLNGTCVMTGPATVGGDFLGNDEQPDHYYLYRATIPVQGNRLGFFARVQKDPVQICEYSMGHGGLLIKGEALLVDGSRRAFCTDQTWLCRINGAYTEPCRYDGRLLCQEFVLAQQLPDLWQAESAPIPPRTEDTVTFDPMTLAPGEKRTARLPLDKIYAGFLQAVSAGDADIHVQFRELEEKGSEEMLHLIPGESYRGFYLHSAGVMDVEAENRGKKPCQVTLSFVRTHYPVATETPVATSDARINQVLDTCRHTLKYCRQTHHLDSPRHCEPLACTGDYYIESLMTLFSFGDLRLAAFDLMRTARMLERRDGRMFHTTYSLIWVLMLRDVYRMTGDQALLADCAQALRLLLNRFSTYLGENGLIETPPDYMFVDWIYLDGHSLHHPPKALGQSCLNMYYFAALDAAAGVFGYLGKKEDAQQLLEQKEQLRRAILAHLFDKEARAFIAGLNTQTPDELVGFYMPQNTDRRYITKHANILAACFGVCDDDLGRDLIHRIMRDEIAGDIQPYFTHFLLEAVYRLDLRRQYTLPIIERWILPVQECPKGLVEGFVKPEPTYTFDHSHAWGGTPLYSLPRALCGFNILTPGMTDIELCPDLLGLTSARFTLHTPNGPVKIILEEGKPPVITHPDAVNIYCRC
ncbi:MAG: hypothetical protein E7326_02695 [Clostridiales bacterium]|nr:hypothetical protein [Clostridiales bacterium]